MDQANEAGQLAVAAGKRPWERFYPRDVVWAYDPPVMTIPEMFAEIVTRHADRIAIEYYGQEISYRILGEQAGAIANALRDRGVREGDTVALYLPNCPYHPYFFFGITLAGARVTHLSPLDAIRELQHKCVDSGARLLVTVTAPALLQNALRLKETGTIDEIILCHDPVSGGDDNGTSAPTGKVMAYDLLVAGKSTKFPAVSISPGDIALLQYTGGTTGKPKAAMLTHRNLTAGALVYEYWFHSDPSGGPDNISLLYSPLFHIMGLTSAMLRRFREGGKIILKQRFDIAEAITEIEGNGVTGFGGVPTMWIAVVNFPGVDRRDLRSLNYAGSGGAPLPVEIFERVGDLTGLKLRGGWGMTETSAAGTNMPPEWPADKHGTIGLPLPGVDLQIVAVDDPRRVLPPGEKGEMRVRGPNVTSGYWQQNQETEAAFVDGWLLTGDIGWMDEDGFFYVVDRKKDLILSGGFNVYPQVIENAIHEHPLVAEVMVIGVPDEYRGESAKAFVVLRPGAERFSLEQLQDFLAERLGRHELPRHLEFRAELPRTSVGKYSRNLMRASEATVFTRQGDRGGQ